MAKANLIGVQFHPEVFDDTPEGYQLFKNFLKLARLKTDPKFQANRLKALAAHKQKQIRRLSQGRHVIAFVSGGVDSSVAVTLASRVIPSSRLHAFYIDTGFMRDEDDQVIEMLSAAGIPLSKIEAAKEFEAATIKIDGSAHGPLIKTVDPEIKRQIIGKAFIDIQNKLVTSLKLADAMLLQGTNAADRIESGHSTGDQNTMTIKTHHNQVREVKQLKASGRLIEPLDDLFKDEVRELGRFLGLPELLIERHPFPGPGLAIQIMAAPNSQTKIRPSSIQPKIQQLASKLKPGLKATVLPVHSVGVGGDERSYLRVVAIEQADLTTSQLRQLGTDIPGHFYGQVNRAIYALSPSGTGQLGLIKTLMTEDVRAQLRLSHRIVYEEMRRLDLLNKVSEFPVVLLPVGVDGKRSIVLRPIKTTTFMTVQAVLPGEGLTPNFFKRVTKRILAEDVNISQVYLDLTNKPPATVQWQ